jgi:hypothetical protein
LFTAVHKLPGDLPQLVSARIAAAGQNGLQSTDINKFVDSLPASDQAPAREFFNGTYRTFSHSLLAHASGMGFFAGAMFGVAAIVAAVVLINVRKEDLPAEDPIELEAAALV